MCFRVRFETPFCFPFTLCQGQNILESQIAPSVSGSRLVPYIYNPWLFHVTLLPPQSSLLFRDVPTKDPFFDVR